MNKLKWELIESTDSPTEKAMRATTRAKVFGGWIVNRSYLDTQLGLSESMVFIPDKDHEWKID